METSKAWVLEVLQEIDDLESLVSEHELAHTLNETYYAAVNKIKGMKKVLLIASNYGETKL